MGMPKPKPILKDPLMFQLLCFLAYSEKEEDNYSVNIAKKLKKERAFIYKKLMELERKDFVKKRKEERYFKTLFSLNLLKIKKVMLKELKEVRDDRQNQIENFFPQFKEQHSEMKMLDKISKELLNSKFLDTIMTLGLKNHYLIIGQYDEKEENKLHLDIFFTEFWVTLFYYEDYFDKLLQKNFPKEKTLILDFIRICSLVNVSPLGMYSFMSEYYTK